MKNIIHGDCIEKLKELPESSIDSIVTDPPYELGFMGKSWDKTGIANNIELWKECLRVLKPGGYLLAFSGTRTYHRMASAIEDAGFEVRDMIEWVYGSGFPKSLNIGKAIDKLNGRGQDNPEFRTYLKSLIHLRGKTIKECNHELGTQMMGHYIGDSQPTLPTVKHWERLISFLYPTQDENYKKWDEFIRTEEAEREVIGKSYRGSATGSIVTTGTGNLKKEFDLTAPSTKEAKQWEGWGTATKPAHEPIAFCSKPLTVELLFAKMGIDITNNLLNLCQKYNVNVKDVEQVLNSIHLKLEKVGVNTVAENARTCDWENIESAVIVALNFMSQKHTLKEKTEENREVSAQINARENGNSDLLEKTTQIGKVDNLREQMATLQNMLATETIDLNTILLWKQVLEGVLEKAKMSTISTALEMTTGLKIYNSLLKANTQDYTRANEILPNHEPICMARKPLAEKTVAENCLKYGTGGINIDESRVDTITEADKNNFHQNRKVVKEYKADDTLYELGMKTVSTAENPQGRFPANLIHDNSEEVRECFPESKSTLDKSEIKRGTSKSWFTGDNVDRVQRGDSGNASRFFKHINKSTCNNCFDNDHSLCVSSECECGCKDFKSIIYQAKASKRDRGDGNKHPTVKPVALMEYLIKMVTPKNGIVLDPFAGSGSTGVACNNLNLGYILIEKEAEYVEIIKKRLITNRMK